MAAATPREPTEDERRAYRNRLMHKLYRCTDQAECDRMEAELQALERAAELEAMGL